MIKKEKCIFHNGKIFTSKFNKPFVSAMVVADGKIEWVGDEKGLPEMKGKFIDLKGKRILPGFIDSHLHPIFLANATKQIACTPPNVFSIKDIVERIKETICIQEKGKWVEGWGYDEGKLAEGRAPTRWDLDQGSNEVPIVITRSCVHIISVNSKALEIAGIDKYTPDPPGGKIDRDENGEPTGVLRESAKDLVLNKMPVQTKEEIVKNLIELSPKLLSYGITAITELMARKTPTDYYDLYIRASEDGLKQRTVLYFVAEELSDQTVFNSSQLDRTRQVHIGGVKLFADGSVSGKTAWVNHPFLGEKENYGIKMLSKNELLRAAEVAESNNLQLVVHAMGEQAIDFIVHTFSSKKGWLEEGPSIRIEHASMPTDEAIQKISECGIGITTQPIFLFAEIESYINNLGLERTKQSYPIKTLLDKGILLALSSDAPATAWADPVNPFVGIKSAVTRMAYDGTDTGHHQQIDVASAITLYTNAAQKITRIPNIGQLTEGYFADFIVLDRDILSIPASEIDQVQVEETYMAGVKVYEKK